MLTLLVSPGQYLEQLLSNGDWFLFVTYPLPVLMGVNTEIYELLFHNLTHHGKTTISWFKFEHFLHPESDGTKT